MINPIYSLVLDPRFHNREGASAVRWTWTYPTLAWRIVRHLPGITYHKFLP